MSGILAGFDVGGTRIKAGLVAEDGRLLAWEQQETPATRRAEDVLSALADLLTRLLAAAGRDGAEVRAIGVGVAGALNPRAGLVRLAPNLGWRDYPLARHLGALFEKPVAIDNDAHVAALGEMWQGAAQGRRDFLLITVGTGIGSALVLDRRVHWGVDGRGAELGHVKVEVNGPRCNCGVCGCLESLTAAPAMLRQARAKLTAGQPSLLAGKETLAVEDLFRAAAAGDSLARGVLDQAMDYLALALSNAVQLIDPEAIIVGGGVADAGEAFLKPLSDRIVANLGPWRASHLPILPARLGNQAGVIGAAYLVREGIDRECTV